MTEYHKINTIWKRDPQTHKIIPGEYSCEEFAYLHLLEWEFTEKVDGTNIRVMWDGQSVSYGGKTDRASIPSDLVAWLREHFDTATSKLSEQFGSSEVCLYGEGYGGRIQKVGPQYGETRFILFDVKVGKWWLKRDDVVGIAGQLGIDAVPVIGLGSLDVMTNLARGGFSSQVGKVEAEGIVARPVVPLLSRGGERIITKIKTKDFSNGQG